MHNIKWSTEWAAISILYPSPQSNFNKKEVLGTTFGAELYFNADWIENEEYDS